MANICLMVNVIHVLVLAELAIMLIVAYLALVD